MWLLVLVLLGVWHHTIERVGDFAFGSLVEMEERGHGRVEEMIVDWFESSLE